MRRHPFLLFIVLLAVVIQLAGCYHKKTPSSFRLSDSIQEAQISRRIAAGGDSILKQKDSTDDKWDGITDKVDSLSFRVKHHYSPGYNFVVTSDSLMLLRQQPEEAVNGMRTDSFAVKKGKEIVVADVRILPYDKQDSVWKDKLWGATERWMLDRQSTVFVRFESKVIQHKKKNDIKWQLS